MDARYFQDEKWMQDGMDTRYFSGLQAHEKLIWLVSQQDMKAHSELLKLVLSDVAERHFHNPTYDHIPALKDAFKKLVFDVAVEHYGNKDRAQNHLRSCKVDTEDLVEYGYEPQVEVILK